MKSGQEFNQVQESSNQMVHTILKNLGVVGSKQMSG
jgi:hypothetical protein